MRRKIIVSFLVTVLMVLSVACNTSPEEEVNTRTEDGKTVVNFWHSMGGHNLTILEELIEQYHNSQDKVVINPIFQGNYIEGFSKINSVLGTDDVPDLMQLNEHSNKPMVDAGYITPMQDFIDRDNIDIRSFEPAVLGRYEVDGKLYAMPFNPSIAVIYYNKEAFREVGLDPETPPHTYSEYEEAAEKLTVRNGDNIERYGLNIFTTAWRLEQLVVNQGGYLVNNENGQSGEATEGTINSEEFIRAFTWIKDMYDKGIYGHYGRDPADALDAFNAGKLAMVAHTSSAAVPTIDEAPFEVGIALYPVPDGVEPHGSVIGGASLWIFDDIPEEKQEAAWDFVKFLVQPDTQAYWTTNTGYFPVNTEVYETEVYQEFLKEYPQIQTTLDQLHLGEVGPANKGAYIGVYPDIYDILETQFEKVMDGSLDIKEALYEGNELVTEELERYKKTQGSN